MPTNQNHELEGILQAKWQDDTLCWTPLTWHSGERIESWFLTSCSRRLTKSGSWQDMLMVRVESSPSYTNFWFVYLKILTQVFKEPDTCLSVITQGWQRIFSPAFLCYHFVVSLDLYIFKIYYSYIWNLTDLVWILDQWNPILRMKLQN